MTLQEYMSSIHLFSTCLVYGPSPEVSGCKEVTMKCKPRRWLGRNGWRSLKMMHENGSCWKSLGTELSCMATASSDGWDQNLHLPSVQGQMLQEAGRPWKWELQATQRLEAETTRRPSNQKRRKSKRAKCNSLSSFVQRSQSLEMPKLVP